MSWILEIQEKDAVKRVYITDGVVTLGRESCDIIVNDPKASKHHCTLYLHSEQLTVVDNSSTNGTFVNGRKVEKRDLNNMDVLIIGATNIKVRKEK